MITNEEIKRIALKQSAYDCNCHPEDFLSNENLITLSKADSRARKYLPLPLKCDMVSYGSCIVAQTDENIAPVVRQYLSRCSVSHAFETPGIHMLDNMLKPFGLMTCFMAEYFLPDVNRLNMQPCNFELKVLYKSDFEKLYTADWINALCSERKQLDVFAVGAYDGGRLVGLAGCSADCEDMWQIGVDVLPEYRRQGIASAVTSRLAAEILERGKIPFYCAAWCNVRSAGNAVKCGFRPAWVSLTARDIEFIDKINEGR